MNLNTPDLSAMADEQKILTIVVFNVFFLIWCMCVLCNKITNKKPDKKTNKRRIEMHSKVCNILRCNTLANIETESKFSKPYEPVFAVS